MPVLLGYRGDPAATLVDRTVLAILAAADAGRGGSAPWPLPAAQCHRPDRLRLRHRDDASRAVIRPIDGAAANVRQGGDDPAVVRQRRQLHPALHCFGIGQRWDISLADRGRLDVAESDSRLESYEFALSKLVVALAFSLILSTILVSIY